ncbi:hypothetical protein AB5N19_04534 [Seiridium cardinale]
MGGIAFSLRDARCLHTPRMPPKVYRFTRDKCHSRLRQRFLAVASPIEAPNKRDYGDVDVFVVWDIAQTPVGNFEEIGELLGAPYARVEGLVNCDAQFAVPWPEELDEPSYVPSDDRPRYCQIDLHICKNIEDFHWNLWYYAHGDLASMVHSLIRPFNLTINRRGLFLRIPEIRNGAKKVFITNEPSQALGLLGYDPMANIWETGFQNVDKLFEYTTKCRFFQGFYGTELAGDDGKIMAARDTFRDWVADFIPTCTEGYPRTKISNDALRVEILEMFPETRSEYDRAFSKMERRNQGDLFTRVIKPSVSVVDDTQQWRHIAAAGLKEIIMDSNYSLGFAPTRALKSTDGLYNEEEVKIFIKEAWKLVGDAAWERHCGPEGRYNRHLERKAVGERCMQEESVEVDTESEDEDVVRFPPRPEGFRQTWHETDMNDL